MTANLYLSPFQIPAIASDISVTLEGDIGTPIPAIDGMSAKTISQARKHYLVSKNTCVAIAGRADQIAKFLSTLEDRIIEFEAQPRPAREIAWLANQFESIEALASFVDPESGNENHAFPIRDDSEYYRSQIFGICHSAGIGYRKLLALLNEYEDSARSMSERIISEESISGLAKLNPDIELADLRIEIGRRFAQKEIVRGAISAFTARAILNRINHPPNEVDRGWGGIFEYSYYDWTEKEWVHGPDSLFFFYEFDENKNTMSLVGYTVAYFGKRGFVFSFEPSQGSLIEELRDIRKSEHKAPNYSDLLAWRPKFATVTVCTRKANGHLSPIVIRSSNEIDQNEIVWAANSQGIKVGLDESLLRKFFGSETTVSENHGQ